MNRFVRVILLSLLLSPAFAQTYPPPSGVLALDASVSTEVPNDTAVMTLFAEREAGDAARAADAVAGLMDQATRRAKAEAGIEVRTGGVTTFPVHDRDGRVASWRSRGELILESKDFGRLSALGAELNPLMQIGNVHFRLSREARQQEENRLIEQAAEAFRQKANQSTRAFGYRDYTIREVTVSSGEPRDFPPPVARMAKAASLENTPVPLEGGRTEVVISVSGSVQMQR